MKKLIIIISVLVTLQSCNKFGDINVSPTLLTTASTKGLLTNSIQNLNTYITSARLGAMYVQYYSEGPYPGSSLYSDRNSSFAGWYTGPLYDLQTIIDYNNSSNGAAAGNGSKNNQIATARILKAFYFMNMTDIWGDIPYTEALSGDKNYKPKYDKQQDIYTALFKELTEAVAQVNEAETSVRGDVLFNGNMASWKRFANTIRMTMALRLSKADAAKGKLEYAAALSAGVISSNAQNISYSYITGDPNNFNPWYNNYIISNRNDYAISTTMTAYMEPKADPRLKVYAETLAGNTIKGLPYGRNTAINIPAAFSRIGDAFRQQGSSLTIFDYAQVLFMQAEAAKIGYSTGGETDAEAKYKDAIKASWEKYGVYALAAYNAYIALPAVAYTPTTGYQKIMTEKWVHTYLQSHEPWKDWRRTGFPVLTPAIDQVDSRGIPFRLGYAPTEASLNPDNYKIAVASLGGTDDNYGKFWWAK